MCASIIGAISVSADGPTPVAPTINRKLSVEFMGRGSIPRDSSPGKARLTADDIGNEFWVGVAVDKVDDLDLFTNGVYSLEVAFEYNPNFLEPYTTSTDPDNEWQNELMNGNMKSGTNDSAWWNSSQYEIISVRNTDIDTLNDREDLAKGVTRASAGWKMCTVCVTFNTAETFANARFDGLTDDGKQYLLKLPFKLKAVPAEADADQNPTVLSLVRGPETLDIGSGTDGTDPYSAWEATVTDWTDQTNMKTLFTDNGDISLFDSGGSVSDIIPVKPMTGEETSDTNYTLSTSNLLQEEGFDGETYVYYLSVPNETEKIRLDITSSDLPTVKANGTAVTATLDSGQLYKTDEFNLLELNKDTDNGGEADGFNNTVTVDAGGTTYTIHIRRLLKPKIVLNYGNSPYGEIMKDDSITDKDAAKSNFDSTLKFNNLSYYTEAWKDYLTLDNGNPYNGDKDDTSIFIYQRKAFKDPGFTAYDTLGNVVNDEIVSTTLSITAFSGGMPKYTSADSPVTVQEQATGNEHVFVNFKSVNMRPDVYIMTYKFEDASTGEVATAERKVIAISKLGDARIDANNIVNNLDASLVKSNSGAMNTSNSIYKFKICDARSDANKIINNLDASKIKASALTLGSFYTALPEN